MYPILLIVLGAVVLFFGRRLSVLGAAVGAMLAVGLMNLLPGEMTPLFQFLVVAGLAVAGFFLSGLAKGIIDIVLLVLCTLAGAAIAMGFLGLFTEEMTWIGWIVVVVGGLAGLIIFRRFHEGAMIILAAIIGGLLITRGLTAWMPFLAEGWLGTLLVIVLAGAGIGSQSGYFAKRKAAQEAQAAQAAPAAATTATTMVAVVPLPDQTVASNDQGVPPVPTSSAPPPTV